MKITIRNFSNKRRSKAAMNELKSFTAEICAKLNIQRHIDLIKITYTKNPLDYYPVGKPLYGFYKLYHNRMVNINLAGSWDASQEVRMESIIHELTHVKQLVEKRLVVSRDFKSIKWMGKTHELWKKWRWKEYSALPRAKKYNYTARLMPWEKEVQGNVDKYEYDEVWKEMITQLLESDE